MSMSTPPKSCSVLWLIVAMCMAAAMKPLHGQTVSGIPAAPTVATTTAAAPRTVSVPATVEAFESADIYPKDSGYLIEVKVDLGDHVKRGDVIAIIDDPELQKQIDVSQALLEGRKENVKATEVALQQAQKASDVIRSQLAGYRADLSLAQATLKRQDELFAGKAITNQQLDEVRAKAEVAGAQADVAQAKVAASESDVAAAQAAISVAKSQVTIAETELQRYQTLQQYTKVTAPFDGVITRRNVSRGDLVQSGAANRSTPLFTFQRIDTVRVFCDVPEAAAAFVSKGTTASIKVFGLDDLVITGAVTRISMSLDPATRTMRTEIDLDNSDEKLRPGMYAQVILTLPGK
jgi:multidrug efflux pump subunit AcrA (membrane-fusion protein)